MQNYYCQNSKYLTQNADSTIYMAPKGSHLNCPDGMCAARGSAANPVETVEEVLKLTGSKHFKDKAVSIVAANGSYEWGGDLGQEKIDLPKNITHIICNEGLAKFGRADDRRVIGLKNHPFLTAFGLVLHADIEANSDEGESVLNKVAGRLFGKYIVKAEKTGKLSVALDNITQVIEREHLRDDKWDNEAHVKDTAKLIMKIKNTSKTSLFGKALVMAKGDGMLDASTEDGMIEDCGCFSFCEERCKVRQHTKGMKFLMRARGLLGARDSGADDKTRESYLANTVIGDAQFTADEERNEFVCGRGDDIPYRCQQVLYNIATGVPIVPEGMPMASYARNGNLYTLLEGMQLDDVVANSGILSMKNKDLLLTAEGEGILSSIQIGRNAQAFTTDTGSDYTAPLRHWNFSGSGDGKWERSANGVAYMIAGSLEEYIDQFQLKDAQTGVKKTCDPEMGFYAEQKVLDAAKSFSTNHEPDEKVYRQKGKDSIYNLIQVGKETVFEYIESGGTREFNLRGDMGPGAAGKGDALVLISTFRQENKDGKSTNRTRGTVRNIIKSRTKMPTGAPVCVGTLKKFSGKAKHIENGDGYITEAVGFGSGDIINSIEGTDSSVVQELASGQTMTSDSFPSGQPAAISRKIDANAKFSRLGRNNNYRAIVKLITSSSKPGEMTETGSEAAAVDLAAAGTSELKATYTNSRFKTLIAKGKNLIAQLNNVEAETAEAEDGELNFSSSVVNTIQTLRGNLSTSLSRISGNVNTDGTCVRHAYSKVEGEVQHKGECIIEHLFSEFDKQVLLENPVLGKILKFNVSSSKYGNRLSPEDAAVIVDGAEGATMKAEIGAIQTATETFMEKRKDAGVIANVIAGKVAVPADGQEQLKYKVDSLIQQRNDGVNEP